MDVAGRHGGGCAHAAKFYIGVINNSNSAKVRLALNAAVE
jgi:hypothetical protein